MVLEFYSSTDRRNLPSVVNGAHVGAAYVLIEQRDQYIPSNRARAVPWHEYARHVSSGAVIRIPPPSVFSIRVFEYF